MIGKLLLGAAIAGALAATPASAQVLGIDVGAALGAGVDVDVPGVGVGVGVDADVGVDTRIDADARRGGLSVDSNARLGAGAAVGVDGNGIGDRNEGPDDRVDGRLAAERGGIDADCQSAMLDGRPASASCVVDQR